MVLFQFYIFIFFIIHHFLCLEVIPERAVVNYINPKYIKELRVTAMKKSRNSPYYINWDGETKTEFGNNVSVTMKLLEFLSGRWVPTPLQTTFKLCDFFEKDPYLGQMYNKQLKTLVPNWTCPVPPGEFHYHNLVMHLENFPFNIPFTWASVIVKTRGHVQFFATKTREIVLNGTIDHTIIQKPNKINQSSANRTHARRVP